MINRYFKIRTLQVVFLNLFFSVALPTHADDFQVTVKDTQGGVSHHAVVELQPLFDDDWSDVTPVVSQMKQQDALFTPFVMAVQTNTPVSFPNLDEFRHQVYSYSKAKKFELRLYGKDESKKVVFDKRGIVSLGCNIHDNMLAYIYVTDGPYFAVADSKGIAEFSTVRPGKYQLSIWHPDQKNRRQNYTQPVTITADSIEMSATIELRSIRRKQRPPESDEYQ